MANKDAPFGLRPIRMIGGGDFTGGQDRYSIASSYNTLYNQGVTRPFDLCVMTPYNSC